ncbi:MAG TPA: hypothetical protein VGZ22_03965 [Isosphaeraceae bacterium]|jgi:hypothetical protein|nr:hypothetical protein [Isosphaeraceae bacterium]
MRCRQAAAIVLASLFVFEGIAQAGSDISASASAIVMPGGPRSGTNGKVFLNAQGRKTTADGKYASFGVIEFQAPKDAKVAKVKGLTITLVESIPSFARRGPIKFYLTTDTKTSLEPAEPPAKPALKFDTSSPDGLGDQLKPRFLLGSSQFVKDETGHADTYLLTIDGDAEAYLRGQCNSGGEIRLIVVPDSDDVAATYFGAGERNAANRPKLTMDSEPAS